MSALRTTFGQLALLVGPNRRWRWWLLVALAIGSSLLEAFGAVLIYVLIAAIVAADGAAVVVPLVGDLTRFFPDAEPNALRIGLAVAVLAFVVVRSGVILMRAYVQERLINNAGVMISNDLLRGYIAMPYLLHTQRSSAELVRNTFVATQQVVGEALRPMVIFVAESIVMLGLVGVLLVTAPVPSLLAALVFVPTLWVLQSIIQPKLKRLGVRAQSARTSSIEAVQQSLGAIRDIKLLDRGPEFAVTHVHHRLRLARSEYLSQVLRQTPQVLIETALVTIIVMVFLLAIIAGTAVDEVLATLGLFAYAGLRLQPALRQIVGSLNQIRYATPIVEDLVADRRDMDTWIAEQDGARSAPAVSGARQDGFAGSLSFSQVSFAYGPDGPTVLAQIDLDIRLGEFVGICGPTGGGKSTLVDLLVGLLQPTTGSISVDGRPLDARPAWWWAQLGVVPQQVFLVDDTLRANIAFGEPADRVDTDRLEASIDAAQLRDVIDGMSDGLDTIVGERGIRLSGGQRQRVAIARALYRDPPVLVLDEGTSALDGETEAALVAAMEASRGDRTLIAIAHRLTTLRDADRILVVADGRIVDEGRYHELLQRSPIFQRLAG